MKFYFQGRQNGIDIDGFEEGANEEAVRRQLEAKGIDVVFLEPGEPEEETRAEYVDPVLDPTVTRIVFVGVDWEFSNMLTFQLKWAAASLITTLLFLPVIFIFVALFRIFILYGPFQVRTWRLSQ